MCISRQFPREPRKFSVPFRLKAFQDLICLMQKSLDTCDFSAFQMWLNRIREARSQRLQTKKFIIFVTLDIRILIFEYYFVLMYIIKVNNIVLFLF